MPADDSDIQQQLAKLAKLKDDGALSDDEFSRLQVKLLENAQRLTEIRGKNANQQPSGIGSSKGQRANDEAPRFEPQKPSRNTNSELNSTRNHSAPDGISAGRPVRDFNSHFFPYILIGTPAALILLLFHGSLYPFTETSEWIVMASVLVGLGVGLYFLPSIIAVRNNHPNRFVILVLNGLVGATGLGWILLLLWARRVIHTSSGGRNGVASGGGESGLNIFANDERRVRVVTDTDKATTIQKLKDLLDNGALSGEEFARLKNETLNR
jgi:hypothetical protein